MPGIELLQASQTLIERKHFVRAVGRQEDHFVKRQFCLPTATLGTQLPPRVIDQNAPHEVRGDSEEMRSVLPVGISLSHEFYVGLMHESSRLQSMVPSLVP